MMTRYLRTPLILAMSIFVLLVGGCSEQTNLGAKQTAGGQNTLQGKLSITGSSTVAPLVAEIAKRFEDTHPNVRIDVQTGGSSRGVADAQRGTADIGMASRALKDSESGLLSFTIARDGICVILNSKNKVSELSEQQVVEIYTGKINNWKQVGGEDAPITVVNKAQGRSTLELFLEYFELEDTQVQADVVIGDNEQGIKTVSGNANAIGYVSVGAAEYSAEHNVPIKLLPLNGVPATIETLADGSFPLNRPLNLITNASPEGLQKAFIEYAQSGAVHDLVQDLYFVPVQ